MDIFSLFHTDRNAEIAGVWRDTETPAGVLSLKIARFGNPTFQKRYRELQAEYADRLETVKASKDEAKLEELSSEIMRKAVAVLLVGWPDKNDLSFKGEKIGKYSPEKAELLLQANGFFDLVFNLSKESDAYLVSRQAEAAKN